MPAHKPKARRIMLISARPDSPFSNRNRFAARGLPAALMKSLATARFTRLLRGAPLWVSRARRAGTRRARLSRALIL
jgi:hypothetical protein